MSSLQNSFILIQLAPRRYEKAMHIYFARVRVYKRKEFFASSLEDVNQFFDMVEADSEGDESPERKHWNFCLKSVGLM